MSERCKILRVFGENLYILNGKRIDLRYLITKIALINPMLKLISSFVIEQDNIQIYWEDKIRWQLNLSTVKKLLN